MKFTLDIDCDNAAFKEPHTGFDHPFARGLEVHRLLHQTAIRVHELRQDGVLLDKNGNAVGGFRFAEDLTPETAYMELLSLCQQLGRTTDATGAALQDALDSLIKED